MKFRFHIFPDWGYVTIPKYCDEWGSLSNHLRTFEQWRMTCIHNEADNITSMPLSMTSVQAIYSLLLIPKRWIQSREASVYRKWIICAHKENINVVIRCHKEQKYNSLIIVMPHILSLLLAHHCSEYILMISKPRQAVARLKSESLCIHMSSVSVQIPWQCIIRGKERKSLGGQTSSLEQNTSTHQEFNPKLRWQCCPCPPL